ncbi:MAG TPA: hypothetical protein VJU60_05260 [Thermoleophilaceae bacterium]|nr:hypothetical protein [Thermoleophilaceae bacterium]
MARGVSVATLLCVLALAAAPAGLAAPAHESANWTAKLYAPTHTPKARKAWRIKIVAHAGRRSLRGTVQYHFLYQGEVVSTQGCHPNRPDPCSFKGTYRDLIRWPVRAVGIKLTFQATVKTKLGTKNLNYWIKVRR